MEESERERRKVHSAKGSGVVLCIIDVRQSVLFLDGLSGREMAKPLGCKYHGGLLACFLN